VRDCWLAEMNNDQQKDTLDFLLRRISKEEFLRRLRIKSEDGQKFALRALEEAYCQRDSVAVELAMGLGFHFGMSAQYFDLLVKLSDAEWHERHEDVVTALGELHDRRSVEPLYRAALKLHPYLAYDEARALAVKAIWALGNLGDASADEKLLALAKSEHSILREEAEKQLRRRQPRTPAITN